jgi:hypothetical protein
MTNLFAVMLNQSAAPISDISIHIKLVRGNLTKSPKNKHRGIEQLRYSCRTVIA